MVVPCHQVRAWLRPCLDSVLSQSYDDLELIGVDDASPDDSGAILDEYSEADARVRVLHLPGNVGRGLARNAGLRIATGDYVLFLDADDTMLPGSLAAIADRIAETDEPDIVMFDYERAWWDGRLVRNRRHEAFAREGSGVFTAAERPVFLTFIEVSWNKAYRRSFLDEHGLAFTAGLYDDVPWTYATMLTAGRIATLDRVVVHFLQRRVVRRPGGRSRRHFDVLDQYDRVHAFLASDPAWASWRRFVFDRSLDHVLTVLGRPDRIDAEDRPDFFHAAAAFAQRWAPDDYTADRSRRGFRRRLLLRDDYATYAALYLGARNVRAAAGSARRRGVGLLSRSAVLDPDLAVFASGRYDGPAGDPLAICDTALELVSGLRGVWVVRADRVDQVPDGVEYVVAATPGYFRTLSRASYLVTDADFGDDLVKRDGQTFLQTHHGTPLTAAGLDLVRPEDWRRSADLVQRYDEWDYSLAASRFAAQVWERVCPAAAYESLEYGVPSSDRLLTTTLDEVRAIRAGLGADDATLLVLSTLDDLRRLPRGRVLTLSDGPESDLLLAADVLVTDHSALVFAYANLDRPVVLVSEGWESYRAAHGCYVDLTAMPPGLVVPSRRQVAAVLEDGSYVGPEAGRARRVFRDRFCELDDGRAAERVVRKVFLGEDPEPPVPLEQRTPAPSPYWAGR